MKQEKMTIDEIIKEIKDISKLKLLRRDALLKHHAFDLKLDFLKAQGLSEDLINNGNFNLLFNVGVLTNSNNTGLDKIAPDLIRDAINFPNVFIECYQRMNLQYAGKNGYIEKHNEKAAQIYFLNLIHEYAT